jgi:hypothetical protein
VVQRSRAHGLPAPMSEAVYALLKPHELPPGATRSCGATRAQRKLATSRLGSQ